MKSMAVLFAVSGLAAAQVRPNPEIQLREAARAGDNYTVRDLLEKRTDVDAADANGNTALVLAAQSGQAETVRLILTYSPGEGSKGRALAAAAGRAFLDIVQAIVESGAPAAGKLAAMKEACQINHLEMVQLLLRYGADPDSGIDGVPPLQFAVQSNNTDMIELLLGAGADIERVGKNGAPPLVEAVSAGNTEVVQTLLSYGANPNASDPSSGSPLAWAVAKGRNDVARLLLASGADPNVKDARGAGLVAAAVTFGRPALVRLLTSYGSRVDERDPSGYTALMQSVLQSRTDLVRLLLDLGANASLRDPNNNSILDMARKRAIPEILDALRRAGAQ